MKKYKKYVIIFTVLLAFCVSICFIPIDATRFIPAIENQVAKDLGINIHIERLILRFGPALKVKAPVMHMMYKDGQKFGQFNNVKFFIPWSALVKNDPVVKRLYADKIIVKVSSDDKYLPDLIDRLQEKGNTDSPSITFKNYNISYKQSDINKNYTLTGSDLEISKVLNYNNIKLSTIGEFLINDKKHISYDISIQPNIDMPEFENNDFDLKSFVQQIENLDFHSDIIADIKLYNNLNNELQVSGLLNLDNIEVLDPEKKCQKSFIYLTFLGNKIGVLSNIFATENKKVYIDGVINNSKKPELDLKVKTDEINIADLYTKIKLLVDCSKFKGIDTIKGKLVADFNVKGDFKKIKSAGYLKISDAAIKASGLDIHKINSNIDFSNNTINITEASGYVQNAPILLKGTVGKNINLELLMDKVELKRLLPDMFGIKSGIVSLVANLGGTLENPTHKENLQILNFSAKKDNNSVSFNTLKFDTNKDNVAYISNLIITPQKTQYIKLPLLKLLIEKDLIKIPETNIYMPNSHMQAKAEILNYNTKDIAFNSKLYGNVNSRDIKGLEGLATIYPIRLNINGNKDVQNIDAQVQLQKAMILDEPGLVNLSAKIEDNSLKVDDLSVYAFNGNFSDNLKSNVKGPKKITISGIIEDIFNPSFKNVRVFIPQQLNITFMDTLAQIKGDVFLNGKIKQPDIVGQMSVQNLVNQGMQMAVNNATVDFNKSVAVLNAPNIKIADSVFGINSTALTDISKELVVKNANIKSKYVNMDTILMYKDSPLMRAVPLKVNDGKFYAEKASMTMYGSPLYMSALSSDFNMENNIVSAKNVTSEMYNGKLAGTVDFNMRDDHFNSKLQARGVSAAPIFDAIAIKKDSVSGTMDFDMSMSGNLISKQSLNGNVKFVVHNGRMGTLGKLEHLLYAQNVIADNMLRTSLSVVTKAITLKDTGLFKYLRGDISLKDGIANVKMLQSQGPLMSLFIKGQYNPATDYAKLVVLGRLSDEVVSGLGAFGEFSLNKLMVMLTGEDSKFNITPEDIEKLPQLPMKNTKEFRSVINGIIEKPSSVVLFNWISYSQKSLRQRDVPMGDTKMPDFIESLPY